MGRSGGRKKSRMLQRVETRREINSNYSDLKDSPAETIRSDCSTAKRLSEGKKNLVHKSSWSKRDWQLHEEAQRMLSVVQDSSHPLGGAAQKYLRLFQENDRAHTSPPLQYLTGQLISFAVTNNCSAEHYKTVMPDFEKARSLVEKTAGDSSFQPTLILLNKTEGERLNNFLEEGLVAEEHAGSASLAHRTLIRIKSFLPDSSPRAWAAGDVVCASPAAWLDNAPERAKAGRLGLLTHELVHTRAYLASTEAEENGERDTVVLEALTEAATQRILKENGIEENPYKEYSGYIHIARAMESLLKEGGISTSEALRTSIEEQEALFKERLGMSIPEVRQKLIRESIPGFLKIMPSYTSLLFKETRADKSFS